MMMLNLLIWPTCSIFTAHTLVITALALVTSQLLGSIKHPSHLSVCLSFLPMSGFGSWGKQQSKQRCSDLSLPVHLLQLIWGQPDALLSHLSDIISPVCPETELELSLGTICPEYPGCVWKEPPQVLSLWMINTNK